MYDCFLWFNGFLSYFVVWDCEDVKIIVLWKLDFDYFLSCFIFVDIIDGYR